MQYLFDDRPPLSNTIRELADETWNCGTLGLAVD